MKKRVHDLTPLAHSASNRCFGCGPANSAGLHLEFFRAPDVQLGFLYGGATMGQLLSLPMIAFGLWFIWLSRKRQ